jgi:hypothetical protein
MQTPLTKRRRGRRRLSDRAPVMSRPARYRLASGQGCDQRGRRRHPTEGSAWQELAIDFPNPTDGSMPWRKRKHVGDWFPATSSLACAASSPFNRTRHPVAARSRLSTRPLARRPRSLSLPRSERSTRGWRATAFVITRRIGRTVIGQRVLLGSRL